MSTPGTANSNVASQTPRTKTGCQNCRLRHLKCDELRPACKRCEKAGIDCVRGYNIRWRHGANPSVANDPKAPGPAAKAEYDYGKNQQWVRTARSSFVFLDETPELMSIYDHSPGESNSPAPFQWPDLNNPRANVVAASAAQQPSPASMPSPAQNGTPLSQPTPGLEPTSGLQSSRETRSLTSHSPAHGLDIERAHPVGSTSFDTSLKRRRLTFDSSLRGLRTSASPAQLSHLSSSWHTGWTPTESVDHLLSNDTTGSSEFEVTGYAGLEQTVSQTLSRIYLEAPCWPLRDREEARLLRHYVENLSRNFDLTDPLNHFRSVVPQRAATCPTLMNAIFALSARHLSRVGDYDPLVSNKYHQECLKHLIPMLDDDTAILDENLLASTIILRHLEEFEVPISGQVPADQHSHLLGAQTCMAAQERAAVTGGLRQASFWVGLRQECYVAFVNQRPVLPALEHCNVDRSFDAAEDYIWSCRMVVICADVLSFCYGDAHHSVPTFKFLESRVEQWYNSKPASFTPVYYRPAEPHEFFPEVWYAGDEYVVGLQHFHLSRILLSSYNPSVPRLGPGRAAALKAMDHEIREHVRILCGICQSNPSTAPCSTYASMAVTMAGDKFSDYDEQLALLEVLDQCDKLHAWPTGDAIANLKTAWGWE